MISMIDISGTPRRIDELQEALDAVTKELINPKTLSPFMIHLIVVQDALKELIAIRKYLDKARARQEASLDNPHANG